MGDLYRNAARVRFASRFYRKFSDFGVPVLQKEQIAALERFERSPFTLKTFQYLVGVEPNLMPRAIFTHVLN